MSSQPLLIDLTLEDAETEVIDLASDTETEYEEEELSDSEDEVEPVSAVYWETYECFSDEEISDHLERVAIGYDSLAINRDQMSIRQWSKYRDLWTLLHKRYY